MRTLFTGAGAALVLLASLFSLPARANGISQCVSFDPITISGSYNPFSPTGTIVHTATLTVRRPGSANPKTQEADFLLVMPQGDSTPYQITYSGTGVLATYPGPTLSTTSSNAGTIVANFGGMGQPDVLTFPITITVPIGANLPAGTTVIPFGLDVVCKMTGGGPQSIYTGTFTNVLQVSLTVLSALQASFIGPALNFGEIGAVITPAPANAATGYVRVASSGPYKVAVTSGNSYRMTFPGGDLNQAAQRVKYSMTFLGQTKSNASSSFSDVVCHSAGLTGTNLAMTVKLQEGGVGKITSPSYQDTINVTVTPLAAVYEWVADTCS